MQLREGDVYVPFEDDGRIRHRRILGSVQGRVVYTQDGEISRACKEQTLRRWIQRHNAIKNPETDRLDR